MPFMCDSLFLILCYANHETRCEKLYAKLILTDWMLNVLDDSLIALRNSDLGKKLCRKLIVQYIVCYFCWQCAVLCAFYANSKEATRHVATLEHSRSRHCYVVV